MNQTFLFSISELIYCSIIFKWWMSTAFNLNFSLMAFEQLEFSTGHGYCDTGQPFVMVISKYPCQSHYSLAFDSGSGTTCFNDLGLFRPRIKPLSPHARRTLYHYAAVVTLVYIYICIFIGVICCFPRKYQNCILIKFFFHLS